MLLSTERGLEKKSSLDNHDRKVRLGRRRLAVRRIWLVKVIKYLIRGRRVASKTSSVRWERDGVS